MTIEEIKQDLLLARAQTNTFEDEIPLTEHAETTALSVARKLEELTDKFNEVEGYADACESGAAMLHLDYNDKRLLITCHSKINYISIHFFKEKIEPYHVYYRVEDPINRPDFARDLLWLFE